MSYTRRYSETVSKTVTVSYPKSDSGGSTSVTVDIPVDVNILVDTNPFDRSVQHCGSNVNLLTAAVVATEAAEIVSKASNASKVADTIVGGFFSYIRSEISQQISELTQNIDAHMMHLKELAQSCLAKKKQMEGDYMRISGRYVKIFTDLNNELSNRIFELDKPAFVFKKESDNQKTRTTDNDLVNTVAIFGKESSNLQSKISASIAKKGALDSLNKAQVFLWQQKKLNTTIQKCMLNESVSGSIYSPVCFMTANNTDNQSETNVYSTSSLSDLNETAYKKDLIEQFSSTHIGWGKLPADVQKSISMYFNVELNTGSFANNPHSQRVREMIQKIASIGSINSIHIQ
jgi:hypothetical protein